MTTASRTAEPTTAEQGADAAAATAAPTAAPTVELAAELAAEQAPTTPLPAPRALLLDFGGVVVSTTSRAGWARELAAEIVRRAAALEVPLDAQDVEASVRAGRTALSLWKNAASRRLEPRELGSREIVADFLLADLPDSVRSALALDAADLLAMMALMVADHQVRPGVRELLAECRERGVRLAIVSNAHSGAAHRGILADEGLEDFFGVQVYSDEVGIRKPHPGMIGLAAGALGVDPADCWYVGDTLDRDVAAGRRAGAGAVVITRDRRTDTPPFDVVDRPDLVLEDPSGLLAPLRAALEASAAAETSAAAEAAETAAPSARPSDRSSDHPAARPAALPALLLDHGGVITGSQPNPHRDREVGALLVAISERVGAPIDQETAERALAEGWERHRARKRSGDAGARVDGGALPVAHAEVDPAVLWGDLIGAELPDSLRAALRIEAPRLSLALHRAKSLPAPRPGALELIRWCRERGIVVGIVSNTISGAGVREILEDYGLTGAIGPAAYSDEIGVRKPGGEIFEAALAGLEADRADVVYVGDKVLNDGRGGKDAGIGHVCLLRGGKDADDDLAAALRDGHADHVLDGPADVIGVLAALLPDAAPAEAGAPA
ncbi:HAD-IIIA family hydrolase [Brachybacterium sp. DNPG3]